MNKIAKRILFGFVAGTLLAYAPLATATVEEDAPLIQIAILLDTSNSMDGLIDQAKAQLWKIVNEFVTAKREGKRPEFQVALYEYGNDGLPAEGGHIRRVLPLTTDLDKVSEELFALTTNGGQEYCGKVIDRAIVALSWSDSRDDLRTMFIAGNEPFTQGDIDFRKACPAAIAKGITVNTIFCGPHDKGVATHWKDGAILADGSYMSIDQDQELVHIDAPQDKVIARLGVTLNETYIPYGTQGAAGSTNQAAQDSNAASLARAVFVQRQVTKASANYANASWDLVDGIEQGAVKLEELKDEDLPEAMRGMKPEERAAYVETQAKKREEIQRQIHSLNEERKEYVAEQLKSRAEKDEETLDTAIIKAVREQAAQKNFTFE